MRCREPPDTCTPRLEMQAGRKPGGLRDESARMPKRERAWPSGSEERWRGSCTSAARLRSLGECAGGSCNNAPNAALAARCVCTMTLPCSDTDAPASDVDSNAHSSPRSPTFALTLPWLPCTARLALHSMEH
jgi:hypothetical protein